MSNYIVSARKYRPITFDSVVGQPSITKTLKTAIKNKHLAHAFLFTGPRGVGKTTCARILAKTINCEHLTENIEPCDKCNSCVSFNQNASFNIHELDAASNNSVDDIRNLIDQVRITPQVGQYSVYIIDEVHMLSQQAFNAFLKTLEEPPAHAIFILATTESHKILPTILSRCQVFNFLRIQVKDIATHLSYVAKSEDIKYEIEALQMIAQKADGALRDALSIFDKIVTSSEGNLTYQVVIDNLNILDIEYYFNATDIIASAQKFDLLILLEKIINNGFDTQLFINGLAQHFRELLVCKDEKTINLVETSDLIKEKFILQSRKISVKGIIDSLQMFSDCDINFKESKNQRLLVELTLMKVCGLFDSQENTSKNIISNNIEKKNNVTETPKTLINSEVPIVNKVVEQPIEPYKKEEVITEKPIEILKEEKIIEKPISITVNSNQPQTISIKNINSNKEKEEIKTAEKTVEIRTENDYFDESKLNEVWGLYAKKLSEEGKTRFSSAISNRKPKLKENYLIEFDIYNLAEKEEFNNELKSDILQFLRKELNNYSTDIIFLLDNSPKEVKAYTPKQRFEEMAKKNPDIIDLKEQLGLDFEY